MGKLLAFLAHRGPKSWSGMRHQRPLTKKTLFGPDKLYGIHDGSGRTAQGRWQYNYDRLKIMVKLIEQEYHRKKKLRFEILALKAAPSELARFPKFAKDNGIDLDSIVSKDPSIGALRNIEPVFLKSLIITARMAHTDAKDGI